MGIYLLSDKKVEGALNLPVIGYKYLNVSINIKEYDTIIFTSRNAIKALDTLVKGWQKLTIYVIGRGSEEEALALGAKNVVNIEAPNGNEFANSLILLLEGKRVLFPRAKRVVSNVEGVLKDNGIDVDSFTVYETMCKKTPIIPEDGSVIIFSSPTTVECFLGFVPWSSSYKAVCIGDVTASYLPKGINATVSPENSLEACVKIARELS